MTGALSQRCGWQEDEFAFVLLSMEITPVSYPFQQAQEQGEFRCPELLFAVFFCMDIPFFLRLLGRKGQVGPCGSEELGCAPHTGGKVRMGAVAPGPRCSPGVPAAMTLASALLSSMEVSSGQHAV